MTGRGDPPEGTPQGVPGGGDDEYRSVVFDESFVRAARIQEFSARERLSGAARAVRTRRPWARALANRQAFVLLLLITIAFGTAIYMGLRHPYRPVPPPDLEPLRVTITPLTPQGPVSAASADRLYQAAGAGRYGVGPDGITLPPPGATGHFTGSQVGQALATAKEYLVASSLEPTALTGGDVRHVRQLLNPGQLDQFDRSLARPTDDGQQAATGWLVRFDPSRIRLADFRVRVRGTVTVTEQSPDGLQITTDHTLVYTVRAAAPGSTVASLFTVRRQLRMYLDRDDLRDHQVELQQAAVEAGPMSCTADPAGYFRPLLAGQSDTAGSGVDPFDHGRPVTSVCGLLRAGPAPGPSPLPGLRPSRPLQSPAASP